MASIRGDRTYTLSDSRSPEPDDDEVIKKERDVNDFCQYNLRRLCLRLKQGYICRYIHLDDNDPHRKEDSVHVDGDDVRGHGNEDEEDEGHNERSWRNEKAPRSERLQSKEISRKGDTSSHFEESRPRVKLPPLPPIPEVKVKYRCGLSELGLCMLGNSCKGRHANDDSSKSEKTCIYFIRGLCKRGSKCKFSHPEPDLRLIVQRQMWLKLCKKYEQNICDSGNCSYLHVSEEDKELHMKFGLISGHVLNQSIRKALLLDIHLQDDKPTCKEKLNDDCNIFNCPFVHFTREEFIKKVLAEVRAEFVKLYGQSDCIFHSFSAQDNIVQQLIDPTLQKPPPSSSFYMGLGLCSGATPTSIPSMMPSGPIPTPSMQLMKVCPPPPLMIPPPPFLNPPTMMNPPPPPMMNSYQPAASTEENIDTVLAKKLQHANMLLLEENEKYTKYIKLLKGENREILKALDPTQPATSLNDIRDGILNVFEDINWKSSVKLMEKSLDYEHRKSLQEKQMNPEKQEPYSRTNKQSSFPRTSPGVPWNTNKIQQPPPPFSLRHHLGGTSNSSWGPITNDSQSNTNISGYDNYKNDPMEIVD